MIKAIFYKEWIKMRKAVLFSWIISLGGMLYVLSRIFRAISIRGMQHIWEIVIAKDVMFIEIIKYIPIFIGIMIALVQFVPEMQHKRIKLTLHLPYRRNSMIAYMLFAGFVNILIIFVTTYLLIYSSLLTSFAIQIIHRMMLTGIPWLLGGISAYFLTAWICLEPTWKRRLTNILISCSILYIFYISEYPASYNKMVFPLFVISILFSLFTFSSIHRFRVGEQD